ncbi:MAG TPA: hypothetical protein VFJ30_11080 [Phycisphaerae bacterium]|nr:hypothetical protein [Phycisphaerae bacterium]
MKHVLYCHCAYFDVIPLASRLRVLAALQAGGGSLTTARDLCALAADGDGLLRQLAAEPELIVVACHPRAVKALFASAGATLEEGRVTFLNLRAQSAEEILAAVDVPESDRPADVTALAPVGSWRPWFPAIDPERCVQCKQCLNFCLFGVYATGPDGNVRVENPDHCKTNCPACARVCPSGAIVFPKYKSGPISGDDSAADEPAGETVGVDMAELVAGDVRQMLRNRSAAGHAGREEVGPEAVEKIRRHISGSAGEEDTDRCEGDCPNCTESP